MTRKPFSQQYLPVLDQFGLSGFPEELLYLAEYEKKEYIYQEGAAVTCLLIILKGRAKVLTYTAEGRTLLHSFSGPGSILGEVEMITGRKNAVLYVQAVTSVLCIGIPLPNGAASLKSNLSFMEHLSVLLAQKLISANYNSSRIILYSLENRLCSYLEMTSSNGHFEEQLTQVAELLGSSYRHLLRTFEKLCSEKILEKEERGYRILDEQALHMRGRGFYSSNL